MTAVLEEIIPVYKWMGLAAGRWVRGLPQNRQMAGHKAMKESKVRKNGKKENERPSGDRMKRMEWLEAEGKTVKEKVWGMAGRTGKAIKRIKLSGEMMWIILEQEKKQQLMLSANYVPGTVPLA